MRNIQGIIVALLIMLLWFCSLAVLLQLQILQFEWWIIPAILVQAHLYTGIFITAHDAMHGTVSYYKKINSTVGWIAAGLFAFNNYGSLYKKHHEHHRFVATEKDPDFHSGGFVKWYFIFLKNYLTIWQLVLMAITFNILILFLTELNVLLFWVIPAMLSTLQLFYFGTYLPHRGTFPSSNKHHSSTLPSNHFIAFISCYFFGYHFEHHDSPGTPWYQLYKKKTS